MKREKLPTTNDKIALPDPKLEASKYVAIIRYQLPKRILLNGRRKISPKYDTLYGLMYWLNLQPYHLDYTIYTTDKEQAIKSGSKKLGERIL
jgi:hypothetical protein